MLAMDILSSLIIAMGTLTLSIPRNAMSSMYKKNVAAPEIRNSKTPFQWYDFNKSYSLNMHC